MDIETSKGERNMKLNLIAHLRRLSKYLWIILFSISCYLPKVIANGITYGDGEVFKGTYGDLYFEAQGNGTPVVIINGGPGAGHTVFLGWFEFLLKSDFQLVYFDETGRGRATRKIDRPITPQMGVDDLEALRKHLNAEKIIVLAHSYGGIQGLQYALQYPQHVEKLIMVNASYDAQSHAMNIEHVKHVTENRYPLRWKELLKLRKQGVPGTDERYNELLSLGADMYWYNPENSHRLRKLRTWNRLDGFALQTYFDIIGDDAEWSLGGTLQGLEVEKDLKGFNIPTLIIAGRYDQITTPKIVHRFLEMLPPRVAEIHMFEKSGHWPWVEENKRFIDVVETFLRKNETD